MEVVDILSSLVHGKSHIILKVVKKNPCSGVIYVPKEYIGKNATVIILDDAD